MSDKEEGVIETPDKGERVLEDVLAMLYRLRRGVGVSQTEMTKMIERLEKARFGDG